MTEWILCAVSEFAKVIAKPKPLCVVSRLHIKASGDGKGERERRAMGFAIPLSISTNGGRNSFAKFRLADQRGTGLISFTIRPRHLWSLSVNYTRYPCHLLTSRCSRRSAENLLSAPRSRIGKRTHLCMYLPTYQSILRFVAQFLRTTD